MGDINKMKSKQIESFVKLAIAFTVGYVACYFHRKYLENKPKEQVVVEDYNTRRIPSYKVYR